MLYLKQYLHSKFASMLNEYINVFYLEIILKCKLAMFRGAVVRKGLHNVGRALLKLAGTCEGFVLLLSLQDLDVVWEAPRRVAECFWSKRLNNVVDVIWNSCFILKNWSVVIGSSVSTYCSPGMCFSRCLDGEDWDKLLNSREPKCGRYFGYRHVENIIFWFCSLC